jgi:DNA-binding beta-propeller fold protein YncE
LPEGPEVVSRRDARRWAGLAAIACATALAAVLAARVSRRGPTDDATTSTSNQFYVSLPTGDVLLRVDMDGERVVGRTVVGSLPHRLVMSRDGRRVYVSLSGSQAVAEIDVAGNAVLRTMLTEPVPDTRADGGIIEPHRERGAAGYTTCFACHHGGTGGVRPVIVGSRPYGLALSSDDRRLYVTNTKTGHLSIIDLASGRAEVHDVPPTGDAREPTAIARLGDEFYVTILARQPSLSPAVVRRLAADGDTVLGEAKTGSNAGALMIDRARKRIYVSNFESNTISRFDRDLRLVDKVTVSDGPLGQALLGDGRHLLVADYYGNSVSDVDLESGAVHQGKLLARALPIVNPTHFALADTSETAYVLSSGTAGRLVEFMLGNFAVRKAVDVGALPFDLLRIKRPTADGKLREDEGS